MPIDRLFKSGFGFLIILFFLSSCVSTGPADKTNTKKIDQFEILFCEKYNKGPKGIKKEFIKGDGKRVYVVAKLVDVIPSLNYKFKWEWHEPDGKMYGTKTYHQQVKSENWYTGNWLNLDLKYNQPSGIWTAKLYINDNYIGSSRFLLANNPTELKSLRDQTIASGTSLNSDNDISYEKPKKPDSIAVIIGNQNYDHNDIPKVDYAINDANSVKKYLQEKMGYREGNIIYQLDTTKPDLEMIFGIKDNHKGILYDYIKPDISDVFIYYSGHGAPDINSHKAYFVTKNCNPDKIAFTGYSLDIFYENLSQLPATHITVVIDACFSGGTNQGRWIVSDASPALINISNPAIGKDNIVVLTSSQNNQISSWYPDKRHGLFTYFFLEAVSGKADKDQNRKITFKEIYNYVSDRAEGVPYWAKRLHGGRVQMPTLQSVNEDKVFLSY